MGTTPVYALPFQGLTDPPNGPTLGEDLALAVETELVRIDGDVSAIDTRVTAIEGTDILVAAGYKVSGDTSTGPAVVITHSLTFTAVSGTIYTARFAGSFSGTVANNQAVCDLVHASGASVTTGSTVMSGGSLLVVINNANYSVSGASFEREFTATATGTYTIGLKFNFFSGSGTMTAAANANNASMLKVLRTSL